MLKRFLTFLLDAVTMRERLRELDVKLNIALASDIADKLASHLDGELGSEEFTRRIQALHELGALSEVMDYARVRRKHLEDCGVKERKASPFPSSLNT
jgi:hypothetical protein